MMVLGKGITLSLFVTGIGAAVPPRLVQNDAFSAITGIDPSWIEQRSGVKCRYLSASPEAAKRLPVIASRQALIDARVRPEDVGAVIMTSTCHGGCAPVFRAHDLCRELALPDAHAVDLSTPHTAFFEAIALAESILRQQSGRVALVVGAEAFTVSGALRDRRGCYMYSEGAGAMVLSAQTGFAKLSGIATGRIGAHSGAALLDAITLTVEQSLPAANAEQAPLIISQDQRGQLGIADTPIAGIAANAGSFISAAPAILLTHLLMQQKVAPQTRIVVWTADGNERWTACGLEMMRSHQPADFDPPHDEIKTSNADGKLVICTALSELTQHLVEAQRLVSEQGTTLLVILGVKAAVRNVATQNLSRMVVDEATMILRNNVRNYDTVFRLGTKPNFAVLLRHINEQDGDRLGQRLAKLLSDVDPAGELEISAEFRCLGVNRASDAQNSISQIVAFLD